ncbi:MAG: glycosyltransferase family A protein, partial [Bacteroidota bacterium]
MPLSPAISIIIPTLNRYEDLANTLLDLQRQSRQDFEILVIDQSVEAQEIHWPDDRLRYLQLEEPSASAARNLGIQEARADVLLFMDDDVIIEDVRFLNNHLRHYLNPEIPGVVGCALELQQNIRYHRHWM